MDRKSRLTCYSCRWSIGSCDNEIAKLECKLRLPCPVNAESCGKFVYEPGTDEDERDCYEV